MNKTTAVIATTLFRTRPIMPRRYKLGEPPSGNCQALNLPIMSWAELSEWWLGEVRTDPAYEEVVTPLLLEIMGDPGQGRALDVGSGDGRVMRTLRGQGLYVIGIDLNVELAHHSGSVVGDGAALPFAADSFEVACCVLTLEHIADEVAFFEEVAGVLVADGVLAVVSNHPTWTAPGSTPITDLDGEVLWRPGAYFSAGHSEYETGVRPITFHHRAMAELLNAASRAGLALEKMIERPHHELQTRAEYLGWRRGDGASPLSNLPIDPYAVQR